MDRVHRQAWRGKFLTMTGPTMGASPRVRGHPGVTGGTIGGN